jgi:LysR family transcriptional regulator, carnitine catabolism transcriptional activator
MEATVRQLAAYAAVARAAGFTAAAAQLHMSQSALSRAVADLERQLGVQLLERDTRNVQLTPAGIEALRVAERIVTAHQAGMRELRRYLNGESGTVAVAALPSVAAMLLPGVVSAFRAQYPLATVRIMDGLDGAVHHRVLTGDADFAITSADTSATGLEHRPLVHDRFYAVLPPQHRLTQRESVTWADLAAEQFLAVAPTSSVRRLTDSAFAQAGLDVKPATEAGNVATVGGLIAAGLGVSAMPALVIPLMGVPVACRDLVTPVLDRRLDIVFRDRAALPVAAGRFLELLEDLRRKAGDLPANVFWS